ncbi:helix-turn-helix transcriptional regulator [Oscillospiraceae bacterium PP1C4]
MECHQRLRDLREDHEKTQEQIANHLGIRRQMYRRYETGEIDIPIRHLKVLADYYQTSADYLLGRTNQKKAYD